MHLRDDLAAALDPHGLILRGGFRFGAEEDAPPGASGEPATIRAAGRAGGYGGVAAFHALAGAQPVDLVDPLDSWSREVIGTVAAAFRRARGFAVRPALSAVPAMGDARRRTEAVAARHPDASALRAVACLSRRAAVRRRDRSRSTSRGDSPLRHMRWKTLPESLSGPRVWADGFAYDACLGHVRGRRGAPCRESGCLDRNACPYGTEYRYGADQQAFHMAAFAR